MAAGGTFTEWIRLMKIQQLLAQQESATLERKRDASGKKILETLCAFANDYAATGEPGYLLIGVNDDGSLAGYVDENRKDEQRIRHWLQDWAIAPAPVFATSYHTCDGGDVLVVTVQPSMHMHWLNKQAYIRKGSSTVAASAVDLNQLIGQKHSSISFDSSSMPTATLADLDMPLFAAYQGKLVTEDVLAENNRTYEQQLSQQGLYDIAQDTPTVAGVLLCAQHPQRFLPMAMVNFVHTRDTDLIDRSQVMDTADIRGDLQEQRRRWEGKLHNVVTQRLTKMEATRQPSLFNYPYEALRELMFNAVMHRDYAMSAPIRLHCFADRIEIHSPGGLLPPAKEDNGFFNTSSYRNPTLAAIMKKLDWIEHYGTGVQRAQKMLKANGNPPAEFDCGDSYFIARVFARR